MSDIQESSKFDTRKEKEAAPADEDDSTSSVVNLTDENFESVVRESTADILLEFYGTYFHRPEYACVGVFSMNEKNIRRCACVFHYAVLNRE